jgi:aldose 1-epimerase
VSRQNRLTSFKLTVNPMSLTTIRLHDPATGAIAKVLPGCGFNCFEFVAVCDGRGVPVLWSEPGFETGGKRAAGSGLPILFPFPGRIRGRALRWQGQDYPLEGDDRRGNAIHGFVLTRPWRVLEQTGTRVVGQFQASVDDARLMTCWPADFRITVTYELAGNALRTACRLENPDQRVLPCALGLHPYFRVPLGGGSAAACRVELPVDERWELVEMLPTGRRLPVDDAQRYRAGLPFGEMTFDDVFTNLGFTGAWCTSRIVDPQSGRRLVIEFDRFFAQCVVYNPPHREAICVEPYSCVPNPVELEERGVKTGLRRLAPGDTVEAQMVIRVQ